MRLSGRCSGGIESTAVVRSVEVEFHSSAPTGDGKRLDVDSAYADQDGKVPGMAPGAATVIGVVMIRPNLNDARGLDHSEARQDQQDQKNPANFIPASGLRRGSTEYTHT